jgi:hypothetical protein
MSIFDSFLEYSFIPMYGVTLFLALWRYPMYYNSRLKFFPVLIAYTLISEILGFLVRDYDNFSLFLNDLFRNYTWVIFNIYNIVFFYFFYYVFWYHLKKPWHRIYLLSGMAVVGFGSIYNAQISSFLYESQIFAYLAGGVVLIGAILIYLYNHAKEEGRFFDVGDLLSWLCLGMLFFYSGYLPIKIIRYYNTIYQINDNPIIRRVHLSLILLMYALFAIGFLRMDRRNRKVA